MKYSRTRPLLAGLALACAPLIAPIAGGTPALAADDSGSSVPSTVASHDAATTEAEQSNVEKYWTAERMASAVPATIRPDGKQSSSANQTKALAAQQEEPQPELGKVFFTLSGTDYVCSGTATQSGNSDVVTTAGHCVNEGPGAFATHFAFVPAYDNGDRPYGTWTAEELFTTQQWSESGDINYDAGFAVLNENDSGQSVTDVVGSYPIAFNLERGRDYTSYGYPAGSPYDGQQLYSCTGTATQDPHDSNDQGLTCDMTGGSSGGGWMTGGKLNSVNSVKYTADPTTMYGPYFGDVIKDAYQKAANA